MAKKAVVRKCTKSKKFAYKVVILNENGSLNRIYGYSKSRSEAASTARQLNAGIKFLR